MRLQYSVICHEFQDGEWDGVTNLYAVRHKLFTTFNPSADKGAATDRKVPLRLVISLIDGTVGLHRVWVSIRQPNGEPAPKIPPLTIDWDAASPTFFVIFDINLDASENGVYDFNILVDGDPLGTVPLPVEVVPLPG